MNINATSCTFYGTSLSWKCAYTLADVQISRYLVNLAAILAQNGAQSPLLTTIFSVAYYPDSPTSLRIDQYGTALPRTSTIYFSWYLNETVSLDSPMSAYIDSFSLEASCECQQESLCTIPYVSQSFLLGPSESEYYFYAVWAQNNIASISPQSQGTSFAFSKKWRWNYTLHIYGVSFFWLPSQYNKANKLTLRFHLYCLNSILVCRLMFESRETELDTRKFHPFP